MQKGRFADVRTFWDKLLNTQILAQLLFVEPRRFGSHRPLEGYFGGGRFRCIRCQSFSGSLLWYADRAERLPCAFCVCLGRYSQHSSSPPLPYYADKIQTAWNRPSW